MSNKIEPKTATETYFRVLSILERDVTGFSIETISNTYFFTPCLKDFKNLCFSLFGIFELFPLLKGAELTLLKDFFRQDGRRLYAQP